VLEGLLVEQRLGVRRPQDPQLVRPDLDARLD
jgi:hypothetical protein